MYLIKTMYRTISILLSRGKVWLFTEIAIYGSYSSLYSLYWEVFELVMPINSFELINGIKLRIFYFFLWGARREVCSKKFLELSG